MFPRLAGDKTVYEYAQSTAYPLERIVDLADKASDGLPSNLPAFIAALDDPHPVLRYWAATGCLILRDKAAPAKAKLLERLNDDWPDVRVVAAEAVAHLGGQEAAVKAVATVLTSGNLHEALAAQNCARLPARGQAGAAGPRPGTGPRPEIRRARRPHPPLPVGTAMTTPRLHHRDGR